MQFNYNNRLSTKPSIKKKLINLFLGVAVLLIFLILLSKFNFPAPKQEIKKNITNEITKLR
tara:strand:+ start:31 stop:213 length:183 start_codon:yes stop_codon:yes gene_type:complete